MNNNFRIVVCVLEKKRLNINYLPNALEIKAIHVFLFHMARIVLNKPKADVVARMKSCRRVYQLFGDCHE